MSEINGESGQGQGSSQDYSNANLFQDESGGDSGPIASESGSQQSAPPVKQDQDLSRRLEFLSKKEREIMARERQYKQQAEKYKQYEEAFNERESLKQIAPNDPLALLEKYGWDMDKLTNHVMQRNDGLSYQEKQSLMDRIEKAEKRFEEMENKAKVEKRESTYNRYIGELEQTAKSDPDRWEMVADQGAYEMAFQAADQFYRDKGVFVSNEEVLDIVESYLDQQLSKGLKYKKVLNRIGKNQESGDTQGFQQTNQQQSYREPKTLTNNFAPVAPSNSNKYLTPEESKARIAKMMGNSLWNE